jgi:hypothetical protein
MMNVVIMVIVRRRRVWDKPVRKMMGAMLGQWKRR